MNQRTALGLTIAKCKKHIRELPRGSFTEIQLLKKYLSHQYNNV